MIHLEQFVYLARWKYLNKEKRKEQREKDWTIEEGRMVERLLFVAPTFAPLALALYAFDTQPLPLWRSGFVHAGFPPRYS